MVAVGGDPGARTRVRGPGCDTRASRTHLGGWVSTTTALLPAVLAQTTDPASRPAYCEPTPRTTMSDDLPPQQVHPLREPQAPLALEPFYSHYHADVPIAIDMGASAVRIGLTNSADPLNVFPALVARHRDRKSNHTLTLVGNDIYREAAHISTLRSSARSPYDGALITNWDSTEAILDYSLEHLSVASSTGALTNPVIMSEPVGCPASQRRGMYEILFEAYRAPRVALGVDSLFSYYAHSPGRSGLVVSVGHELTHLIPVLQGRGVLLNCKRIDWGANQALQFLQKSLALKYPYFPSRLSTFNTSCILRDHAYVLTDYDVELSSYLHMENLETKDVVIQVPVEIAPEKAKKSDEELARQAEKRKEQGRRLQEQAQKKRLEKLVQKEQEYEYYTQLQDTLSKLSKAEAERRAQAEEFDGTADLAKYIENLEKSLKKARAQDYDEPEEDINPETAWPLAEIPDADLSEEQIKEKRRQKLLKSNYDARVRAKEEKQREEEERAQRAKEEQEWRARDLSGWCDSKRLELAKHISEYKQRAKLMESMKDRKSMAAQQRMKTIADLANDLTSSTSAASRKRRRNVNVTIDNDPNDTFGTNDDDWNAYRDNSTAALEEEQTETNNEILRLEEDLLEHDPEFHHEDTFAASESFDWQNLVLHKFIHGPRQNLTIAMQAEGHDPEELVNNPEIIRRNHQLHINIERIRVPEVYFQPHIAGLDQAGIPEVIQNLIFRNFDGNLSPGGQLREMIENVFITGGGSLLPNFGDRIKKELTAVLPSGTPFKVTRASDPILNPWRGMQKWAQSESAVNNYVTREEYEEYGPEYIKEHGLGNVCLRNL